MVIKWISIATSLTLLTTIASFSSSTTYQLQNYSVGPGGDTGSSSSTYHAQTSTGEQATGVSNGTTNTGKSGSIQAEQLDKPLAPTLSNGSNTYYNMLNCTLNTSNMPSDATYAIAVSTASGFTSYNYVQSNGTLGPSAVYQTYTQWGGTSGTPILGLAANTTYYVEVDAQQGMYTDTGFGAQASASTVGPTISFSLTPNSSSIGALVPGTVVTSSNMNFTFATNGVNGGDIYVAGANNGFRSASKSYTISAFSGNLSGQSQGFGIQATSPTQTSGGPLSTVSPFNGTSHTVGAESTSFAPMLTSSASIVGGSASANIQALINSTTPPASDYNEIFTFIAAANF